MVKIGLERIDTQKEVTVEVLLDSRATGLVMSSEFAKKQGFKLKKLERLINVRNMDGQFNKEGPIKKYGGSKHLLSGTQEEDRDRCYWRTKVDSNLGDAVVSAPQF